VVQLNALDDRSVPDKQAWANAMRFMEHALREKMEQTKSALDTLKGPSFTERWTKWAHCDEAHWRRQAAETELNMLLRGEPVNLIFTLFGFENCSRFNFNVDSFLHFKFCSYCFHCEMMC